jgi:hypothetical protein
MVADKLETSGVVMGMVMVKSPVAVLCWQQLCSSRSGWIAMIQISSVLKVLEWQ